MTPGRPLLWVTTKGFLVHFGLDALGDLPAAEELRAAGLLDLSPPVLGARRRRSRTALADPNRDHRIRCESPTDQTRPEARPQLLGVVVDL